MAVCADAVEFEHRRTRMQRSANGRVETMSRDYSRDGICRELKKPRNLWGDTNMRIAAHSIALALVATTAAHAQKPAIRLSGDMPTTRFTLDASPSRAFLDTAFVRDVLPKLHAEAERIREGYDIQDQALADQLRSGLVSIALLQ